MFDQTPLLNSSARILAACTLTLVAACASTPTAESASGSNGSSGSTDTLASPAAVSDDRIVLVAHGMACPKCVTNADLQLMKLPGVQSVRIDMQHGILDMTVDVTTRPSRAEIAKAIDDAGLTLVSVQGRTADGDGS